MRQDYLLYEGPHYTVEFYLDANGKSQAAEYFFKLPNKRQDKLYYLVKRIADLGEISNLAKFRNEGNGIYAFKPQPDRFLSFFFKGGKIIITNAFEKKQNKLPRSEKVRALKFKKDYEARVKKGTYYEKE